MVPDPEPSYPKPAPDAEVEELELLQEADLGNLRLRDAVSARLSQMSARFPQISARFSQMASQISSRTLEIIGSDILLLFYQ